MNLVQVALQADGSVIFTCRVCQEHCPAPDGVPLDRATREFLAMHPACADADAHDEGCPEDGEAVGG
jgi:hypothetical protein